MNRNEIIGKVSGVNGAGKQFSFNLTLRKMKHIRRCLKLHNHIHPADASDDLQENLIREFMLFGRRTGRRLDIPKKELREKLGNVCAIPGCNATENLTLDHKIPLSDGGTNRIDNYQLICDPHNNIKSLKWRIDMKEKELTRLKFQLMKEEGKVKNVDKMQKIP